MMRGLLQPVSTGIVAAVTGFASSFVLVIAGLRAVGASEAQAASGLLMLCLLVGLTCIVLPWYFRMPISFAWSTPGAALLVAAGASTDDFGATAGAFMVCGALIVLCGLWPALGRAITSIPKPLAGAMLAGILFPICLAPITASIEQPLLAIPVILVWLVLFRLAPRWAVPAAMVTAAIGLGLTSGTDWLTTPVASPALIFTGPVFDPLVIVSLGLPLFIVTMAGQNVPGFAVLSTFGYHPPPRPILVGSGIATVLGAVFGAHSINLAAITAALMASPDAHPDTAKRWIATVSSGFTYLVLGLAAGLATALVAASPPVVIIAVAGLAFLGALVTSITSALEDPQHRISAIVTLLVTVSGVSIGGIGSAFWGLVIGGAMMLWLGEGRTKARRTKARRVS
ncbi:benzoate/H(+) symporter BenE family transporter [Cryobacterium sp. CG_9.6]|uniref:benzoate/H(+) symporter BenE family transporter n=1 Tax=Cryobacterium sp. CG_9.6 TaxID=2760710 RepID=UPI002475DFE6|nr:benzoate/H(+) symporter BenE family transporter [Cryobacterium sp. CG_9.6]MDH6237404.1 benzoate membrane transport protein [Cryobacterium sp. CG_9.6]